MVSGTNIKTINNVSLLGSGNIEVQSASEIHIGDDAPTGQEIIWIDTDEPDITLADLADDSTHRLVTDTEKSTWNGKQDELVSGTNIKTINNQSLLGSGNITIQGGGGGTATDVQINGTSIVSNDVANIITKSAYNASSNKIATESDLPDISGKQDTIDSSHKLSADLVDDTSSTNKFVSASDKTAWSAKYDKPSGGIPDTDLSSAVQTSLGKADTALQSISSSDVTTALGYTPYNSSNPNGYTSNTGTITGITMNGTSKGTSGIVDLGTVITDISGKQDTIDSSHKLSADLVDDSSTTNKFVTSSDKTTWSGKQDALVSGTNIKTINNQSLLGSGNITIQGGGGSSTDVQVNGTSITSNGVANLITETAYNASTNKLATISDISTSGVNVTVGSSAPTTSTPGKEGDFYISNTIPSYIYQCVYADDDPQDPVYSWKELVTPDTATDIQVNGSSIVSSGAANILTKTAYDPSTNKIATESDLPNTIQYSTMPTASVDNLGDIVQYTGTTTTSSPIYTNGYFYKCVSDGASTPTYSWENIGLQSYDKLSDRPKINNIPISGNKTAQMYGLQPAGNYASDATITSVNTATLSREFTNNVEYRCTVDMTSITMTLPSTVPNNYIVWLVFPSGSTATSFNYPSTILFTGDDVSNNVFTPVTDKTYNVCIWNDGLNINGVVRGV